MRFPRIAALLHAALQRRFAAKRSPDFIIGADALGGAYLLRWYVTPWRRWYRDIDEDRRTRWQRFAVGVSRLLPNIYLHKFQRSDDDRALHDHPSCAVSFMLHGGYGEHTIANGGIHHRKRYGAGSLRFMGTMHAHRVEIDAKTDCWTLFAFGPTVREWGFHCPERGWVHWKLFTAYGKPGEIGPGCGE